MVVRRAATSANQCRATAGPPMGGNLSRTFCTLQTLREDASRWRGARGGSRRVNSGCSAFTTSRWTELLAESDFVSIHAPLNPRDAPFDRSARTRARCDRRFPRQHGARVRSSTSTALARALAELAHRRRSTRCLRARAPGRAVAADHVQRRADAARGKRSCRVAGNDGPRGREQRRRGACRARHPTAAIRRCCAAPR